MSDSDSENYSSDNEETLKNIIESNKSISDDDEIVKENIKPNKPKRIMSEKQLENLKKARQIAFTKLKEKKKQTQDFKNKQQELKILKKLEQNITLDKKLKEVKKKIIIDNEDEKPKIKTKTKSKSKSKKIIYITDSDDGTSEEEIIYKMKPKKIIVKQPKQPKQPKQQSEQIIFELDEEAKQEKELQDKIVEQHYNDKIALMKKEYLLKSVFQGYG